MKETISIYKCGQSCELANKSDIYVFLVVIMVHNSLTAVLPGISYSILRKLSVLHPIVHIQIFTVKLKHGSNECIRFILV